MGKLTTEIFNPSCCEAGGEPGYESASSCGCDPGANWVCEQHTYKRKFAASQEELATLKEAVRALLACDVGEEATPAFYDALHVLEALL